MPYVIGPWFRHTWLWLQTCFWMSATFCENDRWVGNFSAGVPIGELMLPRLGNWCLDGPWGCPWCTMDWYNPHRPDPNILICLHGTNYNIYQKMTSKYGVTFPKPNLTTSSTARLSNQQGKKVPQRSISSSFCHPYKLTTDQVSELMIIMTIQTSIS